MNLRDRRNLMIFVGAVVLVALLLIAANVYANDLERSYLPVVFSNSTPISTPAPTWSPCWMIPPELGICPPAIPTPGTPLPVP